MPEVVVSNRGPLSFRLDDDGRPVATGTGGGLAGTLHPLLAGTGSTWVSASMNEADRLAAAEGLMAEDGLRLVMVAPEPDVYRMAYDVVSNATLWFCHHHLFDLPRRPRFDRHWREAWEAYRAYNRLFADAVAAEAGPGEVVLVQDYHLALVGAMVAKSRPDLRTVHFSHTPFADPNVLRCLPSGAAGELLGGHGRVRGVRVPHDALGSAPCAPRSPIRSWRRSPGRANRRRRSSRRSVRTSRRSPRRPPRRRWRPPGKSSTGSSATAS